ncbi:MAG: hypothetical protein LBK76_04600 [Verrucomicrobiales bacterium]|jgi:hypothetical protein|nr:hypothetical protein [Verrucomicrobiales bacterium]
MAREIKRSSGQTAFTISISKELLQMIEQRAQELEMDRSSYMRWCAKLELGLVNERSIKTVKFGNNNRNFSVKQ